MKITGILFAGMLLLSNALLAPAVLAQDHHTAAPAGEVSTHVAWADVLRVDPIYDEATQAPATTEIEQRCYDEQVPIPAAADNRANSTVIGAIIGSVIGHTFGHGNGRTAATAAGAVAGAAVGNSVAAPKAPPGYTIERRCRPVRVAKPQRRIAAYDVEYRYRGEIYAARLPYDPGDRMRVRVSVVPAE